MILDRTPLSLNEVQEILKDIPDNERKVEMELYLKKFSKMKSATAIKIKEELEKLDLLKMKREHLVKLVDLMPEDASELNKIFNDVSLNEDETNKILEVIKTNK